MVAPTYAAAMTIAFNVIGLVVSDMARSLDFYRQLGLSVPAGAQEEPHVEVSLPGGLRIAFDLESTIRSFDPDWAPAAAGSSRVNLAFACDSPAEVDAVYAELTAAGHPGHLPPWDAFWGQRYASITDPDGNPIDLYAALPAAATSATAADADA